MCLQAIVQVYGLLAPMIHQRISAKPIIQVLLHCHAVLQEVPSLTRHRRQTSTSDSLSHMIATITYFVAKVGQNVLIIVSEHTFQSLGVCKGDGPKGIFQLFSLYLFFWIHLFFTTLLKQTSVGCDKMANQISNEKKLLLIYRRSKEFSTF